MAQCVSRRYVTDFGPLGQALGLLLLSGGFWDLRSSQKQIRLEARGLCEYAGSLGLTITKIMYLFIIRLIGDEVKPLERLQPVVRRNFVPGKDALGQAELGWTVVLGRRLPVPKHGSGLNLRLKQLLLRHPGQILGHRFAGVVE